MIQYFEGVFCEHCAKNGTQINGKLNDLQYTFQGILRMGNPLDCPGKGSSLRSETHTEFNLFINRSRDRVNCKYFLCGYEIVLQSASLLHG